MSAITGISGFNRYTNYPGIYSNPSDAAIAEKTEAQVRGIDQGTENLRDANSVTKIADGAMDGIADQLHRMRELAIKASNTAVVGDDERKMIQTEIDQLKQGISDIANTTTFNEKKLLDGSTGELTILAGEGSTEQVSTGNMTLEALGIKDFDVTGDFNLKTLDDALKTVSGQRATIGAQSNRLDHATAYNQLSSYNHVASFKEDDLSSVVKRVDEMRKNRMFDTARMMMMQKDIENRRAQTIGLFQ
ncbi:MAG: flagellin FliC5 [Lachnospiraceae bacterium]|nr:flagellin FliC5 [Lachnospiraceae bacterium]MBR0092491.1 flagellin FliC5 [Lachnospiraceae bacterium]